MRGNVGAINSVSQENWRKKTINTALNWYLSGSLTHGNVSAIGFVPQNKGGFIVSENLELVGEEKGVELVEENFEATKEIENGNKWDRTYEVNTYTAWD